jgi:hypothetical protein
MGRFGVDRRRGKRQSFRSSIDKVSTTFMTGRVQPPHGPRTSSLLPSPQSVSSAYTTLLSPIIALFSSTLNSLITLISGNSTNHFSPHLSLLMPSSMLKLNCLVFGDHIDSIFNLEIERTKSVLALEKRIKTEWPLSIPTQRPSNSSSSVFPMIT